MCEAAGERWAAELSGRLEALEHRLRRRRRLAVALLLAAMPASAALGRASALQPVRASGFVLVDAAGRTRAELALDTSGTARLSLSDGAGVRRVSLSATEQGAATISVHDAFGGARAALDVDGGQVPGLVLSDAQGRGRLRLHVKDSGPVVNLVDWNGRLGVSLATDGGSPRLALTDGPVDRLWLALRRDSPTLQIFDAGGHARTGLVTFNQDRGLAVVSQTDGSEPGLVLYGQKGRIFWSAP